MSETIVFLIRHGEIENPKKVLYGSNIDFPLNDTGRGQINQVAEKIKKIGEIPHIIYTSPLIRAEQSSQIIAGKFGLEDSIRIEDNLKDVNIPALAGKPFTIRKELHAQGLDEYSEKFVSMGNESRKQVVDRMKKVFRKIVSGNKGKIIVIISHGDPIQFLLYSLEHPTVEIPSMDTIANQNYPPKGSVVRLVIDENGSLTKKTIL